MAGAHPDLTPVYEKLGLFSVYDSPWFSAIYLLLMVSLVGCFVPRSFVYWRAMRAAPPPAPRNLNRLPDHASYRTEQSVDEVVGAAERLLRQAPLPGGGRGRDRVGASAATCARRATCSSTCPC